MSLKDDHVQITADISEHSAALGSIAMRLNAEGAYKDIWATARYLVQLLDERMKHEPQG